MIPSTAFRAESPPQDPGDGKRNFPLLNREKKTLIENLKSELTEHLLERNTFKQEENEWSKIGKFLYHLPSNHYHQEWEIKNKISTRKINNFSLHIFFKLRKLLYPFYTQLTETARLSVQWELCDAYNVWSIPDRWYIWRCGKFCCQSLFSMNSGRKNILTVYSFLLRIFLVWSGLFCLFKHTF